MPTIVKKEVTCSPKKIDWLNEHARSQLGRIIDSNGVHIQLPTAKANKSIVIFTGIETVHIERAIRSFMRLACDVYVASIQTSKVVENQDSFLKLLKDLTPLFSSISLRCSVDFTVQRNIIDLYGSKEATKQAYQEICSSDIVKSFIRDTKVQIELASEHRDFLNGKKNGKVNKITKTSQCRITFQDTANDYNMTIDIYNAVPSRLALGIEMLEGELPAETSFYIPESFHKRIIGVGGKNIQKIMKQFGVYVKFSNSDEFARLGGYFENMDNVIARTPAKNEESLQNLKGTIVESVEAFELIEGTRSIECPRQLHSWLLRQENVQKIQDSNLFRIKIPNTEDGNDTVVLQGPREQLETIQHTIHQCIPAVISFEIRSNRISYEAVHNKTFDALKKKLKKGQVDLWIFAPPFAGVKLAYDYSCYFVYQSSKQAIIGEYKDMVLKYFESHDVSFV